MMRINAQQGCARQKQTNKQASKPVQLILPQHAVFTTVQAAAFRLQALSSTHSMVNWVNGGLTPLPSLPQKKKERKKKKKKKKRKKEVMKVIKT